MTNLRRGNFESLESRLCLAVTATVSDGDLLVQGDADGLVEIVAVSNGAYRVTDNGTLIADETTLQGVTDDIHIKLEATVDGSNDAVAVDLAGQVLDQVYADLGDGDNSFELTGGLANGFVYRGGDGIDSVSVDTTVESRALLFLGDGENDLTVTGQVKYLSIHGGDGSDMVAIADTADISGGVTARLGDGNNSMSLAGTVEGHFMVSARDGVDMVTVDETATIGRSAKIALGDGENSTTVAGTIEGNLLYHGGDGNDSVTLEESSVIEESLIARLGDGENTVTHAGTVNGDFRVVSSNENDVVDTTAGEIGGEEHLGLGEQHDHSDHWWGGWGRGERGWRPFFFRGGPFGFFGRGFGRF
jgi:hypothetical protein